LARDEGSHGAPVRRGYGRCLREAQPRRAQGLEDEAGEAVTRWYRLSPFYWLTRWRVRRIVKRWSFNATTEDMLKRHYGPEYVREKP